jgi:polar amino acid transport system substrate-binding protein/arginine/ornithine transport system substrate-binding protein
MKRIISAAIAATSLAAAGSVHAMDICVEGAYPPFSETSPDGSIVGFDIDIANALCAEIGQECNMVKTDWDGIIPALLEGKCDAIIASMSITPERQEVIDFTNKYYQTPAMFVAAADAGFEDTPEAMAGKVVGVQRGSIHQGFMEGEFPDVELRLYGTQDEAHLDLAAGRLDAVMADTIAIEDGFLKTPAGEGYAFFGQSYSIPKYHGPGAGIGVRKGEDELRESLNAAIEAIRASGQYDGIAETYFDFDIYGGTS